MTTIRRVRAAGRRGIIAASVIALVGALVAAYVVTSAGAASKPPAPTILTGPANPTTSSSASFTFSDSQAGVTFKCSRDNALFTTCASGIAYSGLAQGNHTFQVEAVSGSSTSNATSVSWAIVPPAPTIVSHPASPTGATSATFTYTDTQSGVGFKCSLDGASFNSCSSSGVTYNGLAGGSHTFNVEVQVGSNPPSAAASFTWVVDRTPPTIAVAFPANGGSYNAAGWSVGCSPVGICGTAADPSGVASVAVAVLQQSSGRYWNGAAFASSSIVFNPASGTTTWKYAIARPADGRYTTSVRATDGFGNTTSSSSLATATFTIDTAPPPAPRITWAPTNPSNNKAPEFEFADGESPVTFTCKLDSGAPVPCNGDSDHDGDPGVPGEIQYGTLTPGPHCFYVFATDAAGNTGATTTYCWTISGGTTATAIAVSSGSPQFTLVNTNFAPLVAKVTNSSNSPVSGVQVTFAAPASGASGSFAAPCSGNTCVVTTDANGLATAPTFKANGTPGSYTVTATAAGVPTPASFSLINSANFKIAGDLSLTQLLYPGGSGQPLNLKFTNPNPSAITIVGTTGSPALSASISTSSSLCPASPNFAFRGLTTSVTIPANANAVSLSALGIPQANWPALSMVETHTNQNNCRGVSLTLTYSGSATG